MLFDGISVEEFAEIRAQEAYDIGRETGLAKGLAEGEKAGEAKGFASGRAEEKKSIAEKMRANGFSEEVIAQIID